MEDIKALIEKLTEEIKQSEALVTQTQADILKKKARLEHHRGLLSYNPSDKKQVQVKEVQVEVKVDNPDTLQHLAEVKVENKNIKEENASLRKQLETSAKGLKNIEKATNEAVSQVSKDFEKQIAQLTKNIEELNKLAAKREEELAKKNAEIEALAPLKAILSNIKDKTPEPEPPE